MKKCVRHAGSAGSAARMVHVVQRMAPGGIETLVLDLVARAGAPDYIFSIEGDAHGLMRSWPALEAHRSVFKAFDRKPGFGFSLLRALTARLGELGPRVVVVHHLGPLLYGGIAARLAGVRSLVHVEHDVWHYQDRRSRSIARVAAALTRPHHIAVSRSVARAMQDIFRVADVTVVPPAVDTNRFQPSDKVEARTNLGLDQSWRVVGSVGRLTPVKGHFILVKALAALPDDVHVVIVGEGSERARLQTEAAALGVERRLHLLGHRDDLEKILPALDIFCLPSLAEGLPRSVLEAQSCDLAAVATDVGGLREAVCSGTGLIVPPSDSGALASALQTLLAQPRKRGVARAFITREFEWSRTLKAYESLMEI